MGAGWYVGYQPANRTGPIMTENKDEAYVFPDEQHAKNVIGGDDRLKTAVVEPV